MGSCYNKEYTILEGSAGRKIISNKNEAKQFKNGKQLTLTTVNQLATVSCGNYMYSKQQWPTQFLPEGLSMRDMQSNKFR